MSPTRIAGAPEASLPIVNASQSVLPTPETVKVAASRPVTVPQSMAKTWLVLPLSLTA
ncbi:hypothetical protein ACIA6C_17255 [Streptomyces sp. NPDC051578]|uniref:hypothetical protein n=1 Tax=Streptomyces sp. NPDC051578 TaxID=3365662 RepID=UPI003793AA7A